MRIDSVGVFEAAWYGSDSKMLSRNSDQALPLNLSTLFDRQRQPSAPLAGAIALDFLDMRPRAVQPPERLLVEPVFVHEAETRPVAAEVEDGV